ncbi:hypothetical protein P875_00127979 [Aspergillus parasiticus SU-1]|uniref:Uncharacterized protein n=1 Tax=Aspergillus parasiticus (strain ATCC 56775 / NRRL 5862 / SRRC 143 / SU-1) TaxID=1403190 RepID=A0A0F0IHK7_ASPPU|nr:hypothetical protein P875_00127979 [Aspergillus parasiticus SU-1]
MPSVANSGRGDFVQHVENVEADSAAPERTSCAYREMIQLFFFGDKVRSHWAPYICQTSTSLPLINFTHHLSRVIYIWWFLATPALTFRYGERSSLENLGKKNQLPFFQVIRANLGAAYTKIGKFDQILALTQYSINGALQAQYDYAVSKGFGEPTDVSLGSKYGKQGFYDSVFGATRLRIDYSSGNRTSCTFRMLLRQSTMKVYASPDDDDESVTSFSLKNFTIACPIDLALVEIDDESPDYQRVRNLMGHAPGDYSIRQLFLDFSTAQTNHPDIGDSDFGVWTNDDWILKDMDVPTPPSGAQPTENYWRPDGWELGKSRVLDAEVLENVQILFQKSIDTKLKEANAGQIGFTAVLNSGAEDPTFKPTALRFQTYPWSDATGPVDPGFEGTGRLNYLLYLEMTDSRPLPGGDDEYLNVTGNWTDGTDPSQEGIAEFASYVLARQRFLDEWFLPRLSKINRMMSASMTVTYHHWQVSGVGTNCSRFSIMPGTNDMALEGFTELYYGYHGEYRAFHQPVVIDKHDKVIISWKIEFTLKDVTDGGLAISIGDPTVKSDWKKQELRYDSYGAEISQRISDAKENLENLVHELKNGLQGEDKFFFPSKGRFFFKDALFGHKGDLVVKCSYNG